MKGSRTDIPTLIESVFKAYQDYDEAKLSRIHAVQYSVYREISKDGGENDYRLLHSGIRVRQNAGAEVVDYSVSHDMYMAAVAARDALISIRDKL